MNKLRQIYQYGKSVLVNSKNAIITATVVISASVMSQYACATESSIPDIGVDVSSYVTDLGTKLGAIVGAAIGLGMAFYLVYRGVSAIKGNAR